MLSEAAIKERDEIFARLKKPIRQIIAPLDGPGTELAKVLSRVGIKDTRGCRCKRRMKIMNKRGCSWCKENTETIVGWLKQEAKRRKIPFSKLVARQVVKLAIRRAQKKR